MSNTCRNCHYLVRGYIKNDGKNTQAIAQLKQNERETLENEIAVYRSNDLSWINCLKKYWDIMDKNIFPNVDLIKDNICITDRENCHSYCLHDDSKSIEEMLLIQSERREEKLAEHNKVKPIVTYNVENFSAIRSNFVFGDVINSTLSIDNSIKTIEEKIEECGGEDKETLLSLLSEVKELIENFEATRQIPKNKGLINRLSMHLEKHGWFYGAVVNLLGMAAINLLG